MQIMVYTQSSSGFISFKFNQFHLFLPVVRFFNQFFTIIICLITESCCYFKLLISQVSYYHQEQRYYIYPWNSVRELHIFIHCYPFHSFPTTGLSYTTHTHLHMPRSTHTHHYSDHQSIMSEVALANKFQHEHTLTSCFQWITNIIASVFNITKEMWLCDMLSGDKSDNDDILWKFQTTYL